MHLREARPRLLRVNLGEVFLVRFLYDVSICFLNISKCFHAVFIQTFLPFASLDDSFESFGGGRAGSQPGPKIQKPRYLMVMSCKHPLTLQCCMMRLHEMSSS